MNTFEISQKLGDLFIILAYIFCIGQSKFKEVITKVNGLILYHSSYLHARNGAINWKDMKAINLSDLVSRYLGVIYVEIYFHVT